MIVYVVHTDYYVCFWIEFDLISNFDVFSRLLSNYMEPYRHDDLIIALYHSTFQLTHNIQLDFLTRFLRQLRAYYMVNCNWMFVLFVVSPCVDCISHLSSYRINKKNTKLTKKK